MHSKPYHTHLHFLCHCHHSMAAMSNLDRNPVVSKNTVSWLRIYVVHGVGWRYLRILKGSCTKSPQSMTKSHWMYISRDQVHYFIQYMAEIMLVNFSELVQLFPVILSASISKEKRIELNFCGTFNEWHLHYFFSECWISFWDSVFSDLLKFMWELEINIIICSVC